MAAQLGEACDFAIPDNRVAHPGDQVFRLATDATANIPEEISALTRRSCFEATIASFKGIIRVVLTNGHRRLIPDTSKILAERVLIDHTIPSSIIAFCICDQTPIQAPAEHAAYQSLFNTQFTLWINKNKVQDELFSGDVANLTPIGAILNVNRGPPQTIIYPEPATKPIVIPPTVILCEKIYRYSVYFTAHNRITIQDIPESCIGGFVMGLFRQLHSTKNQVTAFYANLIQHGTHNTHFVVSDAYDNGLADVMTKYNTYRYQEEGEGNDHRRVPVSIVMTVLWVVFNALYKSTQPDRAVEAANHRAEVACIIAGETETKLTVQSTFIDKLRKCSPQICAVFHLMLAEFYQPKRILVKNGDKIDETRSETEREFKLRNHYNAFIANVGMTAFSIITEFMNTSEKTAAHVNSRVLTEYGIFKKIYEELKAWCAERHCPVEAVKILYPETNKTDLSKVSYLKTVAFTWKKETTKNEPGNTWANFKFKVKPGMDTADIVSMVNEKLNLVRNYALHGGSVLTKSLAWKRQTQAFEIPGMKRRRH